MFIARIDPYSFFKLKILVFIWIICHFIETRISFNQSTYSVNENDVAVKPVLILSDPETNNITVQIEDVENSAKSEYVC